MTMDVQRLEDDGEPEEREVEATESVAEEEEPKKLSRKDRKHRKLLETATQEYGSDVIKVVESIRDVRERIIYVAEAVFSRKGFGGARTQEIGDLAGVNKAMIHYYFESKEKLYHAVLDKILFDLIKLTQETALEEVGYAQRLESFYQGFFDYIATHRNFSQMTAMVRGSGDRYFLRMVETFFKPLFDRGVAFIEGGKAEGVFDKKVNARQFLVSVYGMTISYFADAEFIEQLFGADPLNNKMIKERREALLQQIFASLGCPRP